jgi:hypothetical protein
MMPIPNIPPEVRAPNFNLETPDRLRRFAWKQAYQLRATIEHIPEGERRNLEDLLMVLEKFTR